MLTLPSYASPTVRPDLAIHSELRVFLAELARQLDAAPLAEGLHRAWLARASAWRRQYPVVQARHRVAGLPLNPYDFVDRLFALLAPTDAVVCGNATATIVPFQTAQLKLGQRLISNSGSASMGHDLPASIGVAIARAKSGTERTICLAGEGSLQMNLQELQTVVSHNLPIKIFVLNNGGYLSIRQTQSGFFGDRRIGESAASGVSFPNMVRVAQAYGIPAFTIEKSDDLAVVERELAAPGPTLFDVQLNPAQTFEPRLRSRALADGTIMTPELDDMYPFLPPDELAANRIALSPEITEPKHD